MKPTSEHHALTVRLPVDLYEAATCVAQKREMSLNALVREGLEAIVRDEEEQALYDAYTLLGQDPEECDVEYAIYAQAEVMLNDDL